jgi:hypothetical protein
MMALHVFYRARLNEMIKNEHPIALYSRFMPFPFDGISHPVPLSSTLIKEADVPHKPIVSPLNNERGNPSTNKYPPSPRTLLPPQNPCRDPKKE